MSAWSAGSFEGVERARARAIADATPEQRLRWLEDALTLAAASGALARDRRERQRAVDEAWAASASD